MLSVIFNILSIIGIILLVILGLVLFVLLIVLFVPITYKIIGQIDEDNKNADVKVHWLFGIIRFTLNYSEKLDYCLKVLWFDLSGLIKKKPAPEESESCKTVPTEESVKETQIQTKNKMHSASKNKMHSESHIDIQTENQSDLQTEIQPEDNAAAPSNPSGNPDSSSQKSPTENPEPAPKQSLQKKIDGVTLKLQLILEKLRGIWNKILYYIDFINEDDTKGLISHCITVIIDLLKSIRPRKLKLNAEIGFDSPDTTGKIYGYLCMLYPFYGENIHIIPDFENKVMKGTLITKGRIFICVIIYSILRILFDKKLYKVIHKFRRGGTQNGK